MPATSHYWLASYIKAYNTFKFYPFFRLLHSSILNIFSLMDANPKETLGDIARSKNLNSRGKKRSRTPSNFPAVLTPPLDQEKIKVVEKLFENARINIAKLEE